MQRFSFVIPQLPKMRDLLRDATFGQCLRFLTNGRVGRYPEEDPNFELPPGYSGKDECCQEKDMSTAKDGIIYPTRSDNGTTMVTWYSTSDPENPQNWSAGKKCWTGFVILFYTFAIYIGSSLYTVGEADITRIFHVSDIVASLGLSVFVLGYAIGPLVFSPLSEIPVVGRNAPYVITLTLFVILCVPTALVDNFAGLLVLRALLGFFGSPALATGGASYGDFCSGVQMPYVIAFWGGGATLGPVSHGLILSIALHYSADTHRKSLGPVVAGFAVQKEGWRWSTWELLWISGPALILMFFLLPETSSDLILLRRARRLRALTGRMDIKSESEIKQASQTPRQIAFNALIKPWEINIKDPAVLFSTLYTALIYGIYYSFFESFPIVYEQGYGWSLGITGLAFISILIGLLISVCSYLAYFYFIGDPRMAKREAENPGSVQPEERLIPGLFATFLIPIGLFIYGKLILH